MAFLGSMTKTEAASRLGVSVRHIFSLSRQGLIRSSPSGNGAVRSEDVERVCRLRKTKPASTSTCDVQELSARLQDLEKRIDVASRLLGFHREPLGLGALELRSLMEMAAFQAQHGWGPHEEPMWADTFERLRLEDIGALAELTGDEHPWRPFYRFCLTMKYTPFNTGLGEQLSDGESNTRDVATIWCHQRGVKPRSARALLNGSGSLDGRTLQKLARQKAANPQNSSHDE